MECISTTWKRSLRARLRSNFKMHESALQGVPRVLGADYRRVYESEAELKLKKSEV